MDVKSGVICGAPWVGSYAMGGARGAFAVGIIGVFALVSMGMLVGLAIAEATPVAISAAIAVAVAVVMAVAIAVVIAVDLIQEDGLRMGKRRRRKREVGSGRRKARKGWCLNAQQKLQHLCLRAIQHNTFISEVGSCTAEDVGL